MAGRTARLFLLTALILAALATIPAFAATATADPQLDRQALRQELMKLPPDQRRARMQQLRQQFQQQHEQNLAQKQQQIRDRWNKATPEQRQKFCSHVQERCAGGGATPACQMAGPLCSGQGG